MSREHDAPTRRKPTMAKPGKIGANKLGVYDHGPNGELRMRGQVGVLATSSTASRFHGKLGSKIGRGPDGRKAWIAPDRNVTGGFGSAQKAKLAAQLRGDKGSNR